MVISDMRDRVLLLQPDYSRENELTETVPYWVPFSPYRGDAKDDPPLLIYREGFPSPEYRDEEAIAGVEKYKIWASVAPATGREYEEAQKLRAETTYKVKIRYADGVKSDFKILYRDKILNIDSVLNIGGRNREIQIVCYEVDMNGAQTG